jgi:hypothetical protein
MSHLSDVYAYALCISGLDPVPPSLVPAAAAAREGKAPGVVREHEPGRGGIRK